jgi:hypothetical protein
VIATKDWRFGSTAVDDGGDFADGATDGTYCCVTYGWSGTYLVALYSCCCGGIIGAASSGSDGTYCCGTYGWGTYGAGAGPPLRTTYFPNGRGGGGSGGDDTAAVDISLAAVLSLAAATSCVAASVGGDEDDSAVQDGGASSLGRGGLGSAGAPAAVGVGGADCARASTMT